MNWKYYLNIIDQAVNLGRDVTWDTKHAMIPLVSFVTSVQCIMKFQNKSNPCGWDSLTKVSIKFPYLFLSVFHCWSNRSVVMTRGENIKIKYKLFSWGILWRKMSYNQNTKIYNHENLFYSYYKHHKNSYLQYPCI